MNNFNFLISGAALAISIISIWLNKRNWDQSNRPIVTAFISESEKPSESNIFNLVISNTGNRPAVNVRLHADPEELLILTEEDAAPECKDVILKLFSEESKITILRNGEELKTNFGNYDKDKKSINYGAEIKINITYEDLDERFYKSRIPLKIYARTGFGGSCWV